MRRFLLPALLLVGSVAAAPRPSGVIDDALHEGATVTTLVVGLHSGEVLDASLPDLLLTPASTVKLVTALALLETRRLDLTLDTTIARRGEFAGGVLSGDLVLVGGGDPSFGVGALAALADALVATGLERIDGDVVVDGRLFDEVPYGEGWMWDDLVFRFSPPVTALALDGNIATVRVEAVGDTVEVDAHPCIPVDVRARVVPPEATTELEIVRLPDSPVTTVRGTLSADASRSWQLTLPDPLDCAAMLLAEGLAERGVQIGGSARVAESGEPVATTPMVRHDSPPLRELVRHMLVESDNLYAESLVRLLDPAPSGRRFEGARPTIEALMRAAAVPDEQWRLVDGSGLSRYNLLSARAQVLLLRRAWYRPYRDDLLALLPSSGEGTLGQRLLAGPAQSRVFAKTGSMRAVYNIAGFVLPEDESQEPLAFALMTNGVVQSGQVVRAAQDLALHGLATLPPSRGCGRRTR